MIPTGLVQAPINRHALVTRHNVTLTAFNEERPLQVGNGRFAFGMDITGLQTFAPFNTMSDWGWRSAPLPPGERVENYRMQPYETHGRSVLYPLPDPEHPALSDWMTGNPHRSNLGRLGFVLTKQDGSTVTVADLKNPSQTLDLWSGLVTSRFEIEGQPVTVLTACHPQQDTVAVRVESPLVRAGRLAVFLDCPGDDTRQFANFVGDWGRKEVYEWASSSPRRAELIQRIGSGDVHVGLAWEGDATLNKPQAALPMQVVKAEYGSEGRWTDVTARVRERVRDGQLSLHVDNGGLGGDPAPKVGKSLRVTYEVAGKTGTAEAPENGDLVVDPSAERRRVVLRPTSGKADTLAFVAAFSPKSLPKRLPSATTVVSESERWWPTYWKEGGTIDLSESRDPRWRELERRIVLSQYLMAVNERGVDPPQESGLVNNGWFGRFHMEMVWWHATHWALWNRWSQIERTRRFYTRLLPQAKALAKAQGYPGARWPKCIGPDGREWPFFNHAWLIWQQPNPIFFAELDYRAHPTKVTLDKWRPIVESTADFLAARGDYDELTKRNILGPPLQLVSENADWKTTLNPTFELGYWRFGLRTAGEWRKRLGRAPKPEWEKVLKGLAPLPTQDGKYVLYEGVPDFWTKFNFEHPALTGVYGMLPGDGVDVATMRRTLDKVCEVWDFNRTWGWDFPMLAMCAARLNQPQRAVDLLLHPSGGFQFDDRGLATGGPFPYFPSDGALLYTVAMMAAGWEGSNGHAPGFPQDGSWTVRYEGLNPAP